MPAFTILRIQRVHYVPAFTILGIQRVHYVPAFTILGIQRVHYVPAFTNPIYSAASLGEKLSLSPKFLNSKIHEVLLVGFIKPAIMQSKSAFRILHNIFGRPYPLLCYVGSGYNILRLLNAKEICLDCCCRDIVCSDSQRWAFAVLFALSSFHVLR